MARKLALVVDDSKSARVILSRMLEKYDIDVEMAESAEQAIEYLNHNRPDAIFMDHLMPGMDGLHAVKVIKSNPQTALIPIMMYTSQEGDLYVGQARALGAMGVLPKQVRPVDVSKVLYELHLLPDRRDLDEPALLPVELDAASAVIEAKPTASEWTRRVESTLKEHSVDIRRFIVASLDSFALRIVSDVRDLTPTAIPASLPVAVERPRVWPWVAALSVACAMTAACAILWSLSREDLAKVRAELAALGAADSDLRRSQEELTATNKELSFALAAAAATPFSPVTSVAAGTAVVHVESVPYGELPFDRSRIDVLRDFFTKLQNQGFHGIVRITNAAGVFCLSGNGTDGYALANASALISKCDLVGNPFEESLSGQQRQSLAFANLIASVRQKTAGSISVIIENISSTHVAVPYPLRSDGVTAGEWNRAAVANNRVEFFADPAP